MDHELFSHMQRQMNPSPEVRAALSEKLARPVKRQPVPWMKYGAVAACAALVIGAFSVYNLDQIHSNDLRMTLQLHSYVTVEGLTGYATEDAAVNDKGSGEENYLTGIIDRNEEAYTGDILDHTQSPNTGDLPNGAYVGDVSVQEEAMQAYDKLAPFIRSHPDWYGGAYIDDTGTLVVCLVESQDPGDKSLELQILDWTDNGKVSFTSGRYSLGYLLDLQKTVCDALYEMGLNFGCGTDEELNRLDLTLSSVTDEALALLAELDPDDDAIYVQVGQRASAVDDLSEAPAVHHVMPGGAAVPDDEDLIADEPYYDGAHYDLKHLPEELPQEKLPAITVDSVPEEDTSASTSAPSYPDAK